MAAPIYKQSVFLRTVLCILALASSMIAPGRLHAETNPAYTVEGVEVDVTAENAVKAREKALDEAQVKAYRMLAERFLSPDQLAGFVAPDPVTVSSLVQDFEVTKEQLSKKRYKGTYTIRFRPNAMRAAMAAKGQVYSDRVQKPVLVLPLFETGGASTLWSDGNPWLAAWRAQPMPKGALRPLVLPLGDAQDIAQLPDGEGLNAEPMAIQQLAARYGAQDVALVAAATEPTQTAQGRLGINIYSNGFDGPVLAQKMTVDQQPGETPDALYARAVQKVSAALRGNWKSNAAYNPVAAPAVAPVTTTVETTTYGRPPVPPSAINAPVAGYHRPALGPVATYTAYARFGSVQDWVRMKNTIDRVYGVQTVMLRGLKSREALLDIRFAGDLAAFRLALGNAGLTVRGSQSGALEISVGSPTKYR